MLQHTFNTEPKTGNFLPWKEEGRGEGQFMTPPLHFVVHLEAHRSKTLKESNWCMLLNIIEIFLCFTWNIFHERGLCNKFHSIKL